VTTQLQFINIIIIIIIVIIIIINNQCINIKFIEAKQAKEIYQYKNIKSKLYRTNAAIWYKKKTCRQKWLTPTYVNKHINGKNQQKIALVICNKIDL